MGSKTKKTFTAFSDVESTLPTHEASLIRAMLAKKSDDTSSARDHLDRCLKEKPDCFEALVLKGKLEWDSNDAARALPSFLKAARVNPGNPVPFLYLGR